MSGNNFQRKSIASLYASIGAEIPRHLLPDIESNQWRRYESEKERIPACSSEEYEKRILNFTPTELETRGADWLTKKGG